MPGPGFARVGEGFRLLTETDVERIHQAALEVLERSGMAIRDEELLGRLARAGCVVDSQAGVVRLPQGLVEEARREAPPVAVLCGRDAGQDLRLGDGKLYTRTTGGATRILDLDTGEARDATLADVVHCLRVAEALPHIHGVSMFQVVPADVPVRRVDIYVAQAALLHVRKPLFYVCHNPEHLEAVVEMVAAAAGGIQALQERPLLGGLCESTAPLRLVESQSAVLKTFARHGLPLMLHAHPIAGFTSPVTLAGELVVTHAEVLALVTLAQLWQPGAPVVYGMSSSVPDMRTGANLAGVVEIGLLGAAVVQLARHCSLPCAVTSGMDAAGPGLQAMLERLMTALPPILAGVDLINLSTTEAKMTFSLEQLVLDDEVMCWVGRLVRGILVDEETLASRLIQDVGPGGAYLGLDHTLRHFREELLSKGLIRGAHGGRVLDLLANARAQVKAILESGSGSPVDGVL